MVGCELLTTAEMASAEKAAAERGVPALELMEKAGHAVARTVVHLWPRQPVVVLCGPGNNGGDGFVAARVLSEQGWPVRVALLGERAALRGDAAANAARWQSETVALGPDALAPTQDGGPVVVDALFGAGLARPLDGAALAAVEAINRLGLPCLAVDVPSGVSGDTGEVRGRAPFCRATVTFFRKKPGHLLQPGRAHCGRLVVADIGIPEAALAAAAPQTFINDPLLWAKALPRVPVDAHKYTRGHIVVAGGGDMTGATRLAARAARRLGAGMVTIASPTRAAAIYRTGDPGLVVAEITTGAELHAFGLDPRRRAFLLGPGLGAGHGEYRAEGQKTDENIRSLVLAALSLGRATVLDADALTAFAGAAARLFNAIAGPTVLTPHEGEFSRLFPDLKGDKLSRARRAAQRAGAVLVLKGSDTVIAEPGGRAAINENAPPSLATAGSGDVLAGAIAGLMGQGVAAFEAACAAVWLHGEAALAGPAGLIAEDLPEGMARALAALLAAG